MGKGEPKNHRRAKTSPDPSEVRPEIMEPSKKPLGKNRLKYAGGDTPGARHLHSCKSPPDLPEKTTEQLLQLLCPDFPFQQTVGATEVVPPPMPVSCGDLGTLGLLAPDPAMVGVGISGLLAADPAIVGVGVACLPQVLPSWDFWSPYGVPLPMPSMTMELQAAWAAALQASWPCLPAYLPGIDADTPAVEPLDPEAHTRETLLAALNHNTPAQGASDSSHAEEEFPVCGPGPLFCEQFQLSLAKETERQPEQAPDEARESCASTEAGELGMNGAAEPFVPGEHLLGPTDELAWCKAVQELQAFFLTSPDHLLASMWTGEQSVNSSSDPEPSLAAIPGSSAMRELPEGSTTLVIRNIPRRYTQDALVAEFIPDGSFDFVYQPYSFTNARTMGYAFINFRTHAAALEFQRSWHRTFLQDHGRTKHLDVAAADAQGLEVNLLQLNAKSVARLMRVGRLPLFFDEAGHRLDALKELGRRGIIPLRFY